MKWATAIERTRYSNPPRFAAVMSQLWFAIACSQNSFLIATGQSGVDPWSLANAADGHNLPVPPALERMVEGF